MEIIKYHHLHIVPNCAIYRAEMGYCTQYKKLDVQG